MLEYIIKLSTETNIPASELTKYYYLVKQVVDDDKLIQQHMNNMYKSVKYEVKK